MASIAFLEPYVRNDTHPLSPQQENADQMIQLLFLSALKKIDQAATSGREGKPVEQGFYLGRATSIVDALRDALDMEEGGDKARDYDRVYEHIDVCLQVAVYDPDSGALAQARDAIGQLSAVWRANSCKTVLLKGTA